jgi:hypothetical protein
MPRGLRAKLCSRIMHPFLFPFELRRACEGRPEVFDRRGARKLLAFFFVEALQRRQLALGLGSWFEKVSKRNG